MHMKTYTLHMLATLSTGEKTCEGFLLRYIDFLIILTPCEGFKTYIEHRMSTESSVLE